MDRKTLYRNVGVLSVSFMLNFTAYTSVQTLQSSINIDAGLGTTGLAVLYGTLMLSNLTLPKLCIRKFGCNNTIAASFIGYAAYAAANLYATWWTIILGAVLCGLAGGPLWTSQSTYVTQIARTYSLDSGEPCGDVVNRLFGIFYAIFGFCAIGGNIAASLLLHTDSNASAIPEYELEQCGSEFCAATYNATNNNLIRPPQETIQLLMGIFIALNLASSVLVVCGLGKLRYDTDNRDSGENEPLLAGSKDGNIKQYQTKEYHESFENISGRFKVESHGNDDEVQLVWNTDDIISSDPYARRKNEKGCNGRPKEENDSNYKDTPSNTTQMVLTKKSWSKRLKPDTLIGTFRVMLDLKMALVIPLSVVNGCVISYSSAEFSQAYIGCSQGIWMIGFFAMVTGCASVVFSMVISKFKSIGRVGGIVIGILCFGVGLILSMFWQSLEREQYLLYIIAVLNGACNSLLQICLSSTVGLLFMENNEVAFGSLKVWQSVAVTVTFIYSPFLCMDIKVYIMLGLLAVGTVCFILLEVIYRRELRSCKM